MTEGPGPALAVDCEAVVFTTPEGTIAALRTAGRLARGLGAQLLLVVPQVVSTCFPVDQPPVAIQFLEQRQIGLVAASGVDADEIRVEIYLCRNRIECLRAVLKSPCLVVIGGKRRWWLS